MNVTTHLTGDQSDELHGLMHSELGLIEQLDIASDIALDVFEKAGDSPDALIEIAYEIGSREVVGTTHPSLEQCLRRSADFVALFPFLHIEQDEDVDTTLGIGVESMTHSAAFTAQRLYGAGILAVATHKSEFEPTEVLEKPVESAIYEELYDVDLSETIEESQAEETVFRLWS